MPKNNQTLGIVLVNFSAIIYGIIPNIFHEAQLLGGSIAVLNIVRCFFSALILLPAVIRNRAVPKVFADKSLFRDVMIISIAMSLTALLLTSSYNFIMPGLATAMHFTYPAFTIIIEVLAFKADRSPKKIVSLLFFGVAIGTFALTGGSANVTGTILAVASGVSYSGYILYLAHSRAGEVDNFSSYFFTRVVAILAFILYGIITSSLNFPREPEIYIIMFIYAILDVIAGIAFMKGIRYVGATQASMLSVLEPSVSVVFNCIVSRVMISVQQLMACVCIVIGIIVISIPGEDKTDHNQSGGAQPTPVPLRLLRRLLRWLLPRR